MFTLKNIKHHAGLSQETHAYTATLYLHGKKVADVSNGGHGGCDDIYHVNKAAAAQCDAYLATLNPVPRNDRERAQLICARILWLHGVGDSCYDPSMCQESDEDLIAEHGELLTRDYMNADLESICCGLVNDHLDKKHLKRLLAKRVLWTKTEGNEIYQTQTARSAKQRDNWVKQLQDEPHGVILNTEPFDEAYKIFKGNTQ